MLGIWWRQLWITEETGCPEYETWLSLRMLIVIEVDVGFVDLCNPFAIRFLYTSPYDASYIFW
jgi:hypothetical protein